MCCLSQLLLLTVLRVAAAVVVVAAEVVHVIDLWPRVPEASEDEKRRSDGLRGSNVVVEDKPSETGGTHFSGDHA